MKVISLLPKLLDIANAQNKSRENDLFARLMSKK